MRKATAALIALTVTLLASCSTSPPTTPQPAAPPAATPAAPPPVAGCSSKPSQEAYQTGMWACPDGSLVFTFATDAARDAWIQAATQLAGATVLDKGARWAHVREAG